MQDPMKKMVSYKGCLESSERPAPARGQATDTFQTPQEAKKLLAACNDYFREAILMARHPCDSTLVDLQPKVVFP
jgi:hypothetical protein